jgi:signal transduction histidine kinase
MSDGKTAGLGNRFVPPPPSLNSDGKLCSDTLERLLLQEKVALRSYAAGEMVFEEGETGDAAYYVRAGSVDIVSRGRDGRERLLNHVRRGELFGEMVLLDQEQRIATAIASESTELMVIRREEFAVLLRHVPELSLWMLRLFSHRLRIMTRMVAQMEEVQDVNLKILAGQDEERRRIGRDIHDSVAQSFVDYILRVQLAEKLLDRDTDQTRFELDGLEDSLREGLEKVREVVYDLYPKDLARVGLVGAIQRFVERVAASNGLQVTVENSGLEVALPTGLAATLYFIVQEALNNVRKHARASNVRLELHCQGNRLSMLIADNGLGFDVSTLLDDDAWRDRYGLISMEERARLAGGQMELDSRPGVGTRLLFLFSVPACK